jgi:hypothetical protein
MSGPEVKIKSMNKLVVLEICKKFLKVTQLVQLESAIIGSYDLSWDRNVSFYFPKYTLRVFLVRDEASKKKLYILAASVGFIFCECYLFNKPSTRFMRMIIVLLLYVWGIKVHFFLCYNGTFVLKINPAWRLKNLFSMKVRSFCEILFFI